MKKVELFYTPTSMKDLEDRLESFSGSEKSVAWLAAMMAWNLACDISKYCEYWEKPIYLEV